MRHKIKDTRHKTQALKGECDAELSPCPTGRWGSMNRKWVYLILIQTCILFLFLPSCKEIGPDINLHGNPNSISDTSYIESPVATPEPKNSVIEDFTGVRCPNCPAGHLIIANLQTQYPGRVVGVCLHPQNSLGVPYSFSTQDLENSVSQTLFDYLGQIGSEPAGAIDRTLFPGQTAILLDKSLWATYVGNDLALPTAVNVELSATYSSTNRQLNIVTALHYTSTDTTSTRLTIMLTEDSIVTAQLNGAVIDTYYVHNDVLRTVVTGIEGDAVTPSPQPGLVVLKTYQTTLDTLWNVAHMNIIAFVQNYENSNLSIYQAKEISVP